MTKQVETTEHAFARELLAVISEKPYRDPLLDAIRSGRMSRAGMKLWVAQAMMVVREFTRFISAMHANCPHADAQLLLAENLWEEHGKGVAGRDHYSLIRRLARSLGATDEELDRTRPLAETADYIAYCFKATRESSFIEGMAAIGIGIEYFSPRFFAALAKALTASYGISSQDVEYLLVHVGEDEDHARRSLEAITTYADTDEKRERAKQALRDMLEVKGRFADAVYAHCMNA
ncbi:MAG TPA: iron-containing redox enzyme family protein [Blastocatellia bacterium]|nr:iron-containing redox enzyme family protein [Blastocatellia bacterium]